MSAFDTVSDVAASGWLPSTDSFAGGNSTVELGIEAQPGKRVGC